MTLQPTKRHCVAAVRGAFASVQVSSQGAVVVEAASDETAQAAAGHKRALPALWAAPIRLASEVRCWSQAQPWSLSHRLAPTAIVRVMMRRSRRWRAWPIAVSLSRPAQSRGSVWTSASVTHRASTLSALSVSTVSPGRGSESSGWCRFRLRMRMAQPLAYSIAPT